MKEIIYIQAGNLANYTGTHFWNTQESYLNSDDAELDSEHSIAYDWDVSFREGLSASVRSFYYFVDMRWNVTFLERTYLLSQVVDFWQKRWAANTSSATSTTGNPKQANFGTLSRSNALLGTDEDENPGENHPVIWYDISSHQPNFSLPDAGMGTSPDTARIAFQRVHVTPTPIPLSVRSLTGQAM